VKRRFHHRRRISRTPTPFLSYPTPFFS
jgi:hypothetical protein